MRVIHIGTSGWSYPSGEGRWDNIFYPPRARSNTLEFYSRYFDAVEINNSFYRPIDPKVAQGWARRTPSSFRFTAKLYQKFTHPKMFEAATGEGSELRAADFGTFAAGLEPLVAAGKLGCLLAQFPPSFKRDEESVSLLDDLIHRFNPYNLVVELRHRSWSDDPNSFRLLESHDVAWCIIDEPKFRTSIGDVPITTRIGYFRFHGRNARDWWAGDRESRYNYLYSPAQVRDLADEVRQVSERTAETYAFYNNHYGAKAVVNALQMKLELGQPLLEEPPESLLARFPELALEHRSGPGP